MCVCVCVVFGRYVQHSYIKIVKVICEFLPRDDIVTVGLAVRYFAAASLGQSGFIQQRTYFDRLVLDGRRFKVLRGGGDYRPRSLMLAQFGNEKT